MTPIERILERQIAEMMKEIFFEIYKKVSTYNDYDIYMLPTFNDDGGIVKLEIEQAYGRKHHTVKELDIQGVYPLPIPFIIAEYQTMQFSHLDEEGNRYRFSIHLSYSGIKQYLTMNVRRIAGAESKVDVLPDVVKRGLNIIASGGLLLIGGQYGHGKTTFTYHLLKKWIETYPHRAFIITMEDPIEGVLPLPAKQMEMPAEYWVENLKAVMREKPDVVFIGEILTPIMADVLMQYASTGMSVVATIHASSTPHIFSRLKSLLQAQGNPNPSHTIASAIAGTIYVEFPSVGKNAKQLYEVAHWKKIYNIASLERQIEESTIQNIYKENLLPIQKYFYPLWQSAQARGYVEEAKRIEQELKDISTKKKTTSIIRR
jgi:Tfp pilus assembly pilus retraction ATPase PilT